MQCQNYNAMSEKEIDEAISKMREWLWKFQGHEKVPQVMFALEVALKAKELKAEGENDEFTKLTIDSLC